MSTIRLAEPSDAATLRVIFREASLGNPADRDALLANPEALVWDSALIERAVVVVACEGGTRPLGFATALPSGAEWEVDDLFVAPDQQRRGLGRALLEDLVERARAAGAIALAVTGNPHAAAFYLAAGFVEIGRAQTRFGGAPRFVRHLAP